MDDMRRIFMSPHDRYMSHKWSECGSPFGINKRYECENCSLLIWSATEPTNMKYVTNFGFGICPIDIDIRCDEEMPKRIISA